MDTISYVKSIIWKIFAFTLIICGIGSLLFYKNSKATDIGSLSRIKGIYVPMFKNLTLDVKYSPLWKEYASAIGGESAAVENETIIKHLVGGETYGPEAGSQIYTGFAENISKVDIGGVDDNSIRFIQSDGIEYVHKYKFIKEVSIDGFFGEIKGYLYQNYDGVVDDFYYVLITSDTMETTHHIELRFAQNESDVLALKEGKYKNQIAMCIRCNNYEIVDEENIKKAIAYHIYRSLSGHTSEETQRQRAIFSGIWDYNYATAETTTTVSENAKRYVQNRIDGTGIEVQDIFGSGTNETISDYNYYMYDNSPEDGNTTGLYLQYDPLIGMQICTYAISGLDGKETIAIQPSDSLVRNYAYRGPIAPDKVAISAVKAKGKKISISWSGVANTSRYQVVVSTSKNFKKLIANKSTDKTSITVKVKKKKTYYVKVRGYAEDAFGGITYGDYSGVKKIKVK